MVSIRICAEKPDESFGIDLLVTVRGRKLRYAGLGALIGIPLAAPTVAATLASSTIPDESKGIVVLVSLIAGVIAGEIAAFGLKKVSVHCEPQSGHRIGQMIGQILASPGKISYNLATLR